MKIRSFEVAGLLGNERSVLIDFNEDLSIFTGRNGAGKTTLLKLIWYVISGNILLALTEVPFSRAKIITDEYECTIYRKGRNTCRVEMNVDGKDFLFDDRLDEDGDPFINAEDEANTILISKGSSIFFPTFRRIEGGFTINPSRVISSSGRTTRVKNDVEEALISLSRKLSNEPHVFISSISTVDISALLLRQYADLSELSNRAQQSTSQEVIETIKAFKLDENDSERLDAANQVIDEIRRKIELMEDNRARTMMPIVAVKEVVETLFRNTGISFGSRLSFGDAARVVNSDLLSAGEKQMLSFICYNAFYKNCVFFVDEPELSLHVDWQRQLFPILQSQGSSNQFIIATHSPFIYSKYPDKEIKISSDRGDERAAL